MQSMQSSSTRNQPIFVLFCFIIKEYKHSSVGHTCNDLVAYMPELIVD